MPAPLRPRFSTPYPVSLMAPVHSQHPSDFSTLAQNLSSGVALIAALSLLSDKDMQTFYHVMGNTGPSGGREGDGVYRKLRRRSALKSANKEAGFISLKGL